jgi:hypothetical protein
MLPRFAAFFFLLVTTASAQFYMPRVTSASVTSTGTLHPGDALSVAFTLASGTPPVTRATFSFTNGGRIVAGTTTNVGSGVANGTIDADVLNGTYHLSTIVLFDAYQNTYVYDASGTLSFNMTQWLWLGDNDRYDARTLQVSIAGGLDASAVIKPAVLSVTRTSPDLLPAGQPIVYSIKSQPGSSMHWSVSIRLRDPSYFLPTSSFSINDSADAIITIPTNGEWLNGKYDLIEVQVYDANSNVAYHPADGSGVVPLSTGFTLTGGLESATVPKLTAVSAVTPSTVGPGGTVSLTCSITPGNAAVKNLSASFSGPGGMTKFASSVDSSTITVSVDAGWLNGTYRLSEIWLYDAEGRQVDYASTGAVDGFGYVTTPPFPGDFTYHSQHSLNFAPIAFTVTGQPVIPPFIKIQPQNETISAGTSTSLNVSVQSLDPVTFQWYEGESGDTSRPVLNQTGSSFYTVRLAATTSYWVRVSSPSGSVDSKTATISVNFPSVSPVVTQQPFDIHQVKHVGETAAVSATIVGPPPLTLQWYRDDVALTGATNSTLVINNGQTTDSGEYRLRGTNPNGTVTTEPVLWKFEAMPTMTEQPVSQTVVYGGTAIFTAAAAGGSLTYGWYHGDAMYAVGTGTTLTLTNVTMEDEGAYVVIARNDLGQVQSTAATLTITGGPTPVITVLPAAYGSVGEYFGLQVSATNRVTQFSATGLPPGLSIGNDGIIRGTPTAAGTYNATITALNSQGPSTAQTTITINPGPFSPVFVKQPQSQTAALNTSVTFTSDAQGSNITSATWYFNGQPIPGASGLSLTVWVGSSAKEGDYWLEIGGAYGSTRSAVAHLTVDASISAPHFLTWPPDVVHAPAGATAVLAPSLSGTQPLTVQWSHWYEVIPGATNTSLSLPNVDGSAAGEYTVRVSNAYGSTFATTDLMVDYAAVPAVQTIGSGSHATVSVPASDKALSYEWYEGETADFSHPIAGGGAASLVVAPTADTKYWVFIRFANAGAMSAAALVKVLPVSHEGAYFGQASNGGAWALYVAADDTGTLVYAPYDCSAPIVAAIVVASDGSFSGTVGATTLTAHAQRLAAAPVVSGRISGATVQATAGAVALTGTADGANGTHLPMAGVYIAEAVGNSGSITYLVVGPSGKALAVIASSSGATVFSSTIDAAGQLSATSAASQLVGRIDGEVHTVALTQTQGGTTMDFSGLAAGVASTAHLANVSVRANSGPGDEVLTIGFVVAGPGAKQVLVRGVGPELKTFGITGYLEDPQLKFYTGVSEFVTGNDDWGTITGIGDVFHRVSAFPLQTGSKDAALVANVAAGLYSAQATATRGTGVALVEAFDVDGPSVARFSNFSVRSFAGSGEQTLTAGFVVTGSGPRKVLIRGVGPTLATFGVGNVLADPALAVIHNRQTIATNDNWAGEATVAAAINTVSAFPLGVSSADAAVVITVEPGLYSAQVAGNNHTTGVALIEVYELP